MKSQTKMKLSVLIVLANAVLRTPLWFLLPSLTLALLFLFSVVSDRIGDGSIKEIAEMSAVTMLLSLVVIPHTLIGAYLIKNGLPTTGRLTLLFSLLIFGSITGYYLRLGTLILFVMPNVSFDSFPNISLFQKVQPSFTQFLSRLNVTLLLVLAGVILAAFVPISVSSGIAYWIRVYQVITVFFDSPAMVLYFLPALWAGSKAFASLRAFVLVRMGGFPVGVRKWKLSIY